MVFYGRTVPRLVLGMSTLLYTAYCAMIDPKTPSGVYNTTSGAWSGEGYNLVFSDEFDSDGRLFGAGNDEHWTAINSYNFNTGDFEAYNPDAITTKDGKLVITTDTSTIALDPSGSPRAFSSGMLQSWNKTCFTGGIIEMSFNLPGKVDTSSQLWAAAWLSGMLGRPAYGPLANMDRVLSNGNVWPYSYNQCDTVAEAQKYSACSAAVPAYCTYANLTTSECDLLATNKKMLGDKGRGMTEIDVFELFTSIDYQTVSSTNAALSTSFQVAPNTDGSAWSNWETQNTCFKTVYNGCETSPFDASSQHYCQLYTGQYYQCPYPYSVGNLYHGESGRDSVSALTPLNAEDFEDSDIVMRLEWEPEKWLRWLIKRDSDSEFALMLQVNQAALASCGSTGQRDIPKEPQYMLFNTALADQAGWVNTTDTALWDDGPYEFKVDYVRYYQRAAATSASCSTDDYPSAEFIANNPTAFENPDATAQSVECSTTCGNATTSANWTAGVYSFHDTRCPAFGSIYTTGCTPPYENLCRACFTTSAFEKAAFTADGVFGDNKYNSGNKDSAAPASKPICPPCVCEKWGLDASECAEQSLPKPSVSTCKALSIPHPSGTSLSVQYCSNANRTSSESLAHPAPRAALSDSADHVRRKPVGQERRKFARRPPPGGEVAGLAKARAVHAQAQVRAQARQRRSARGTASRAP